MTPQVTVWFDAACPLCVREIALYRRLDARRGRIAFVDLTDPAAPCPLDRAAMLARFHAAEAGRPPVSGAAAFAAMFRAVPLMRPLGEAMRLPPILWTTERLYRLFLVVRPALQRLVHRLTDTPGAATGGR